jgi:hypothetical protein
LFWWRYAHTLPFFVLVKMCNILSFFVFEGHHGDMFYAAMQKIREAASGKGACVS